MVEADMSEISLARCTAAGSHGRFCDRESLPNAPFPICLKHASWLMQYLNDRVADRGPALQVAREIATAERPDVTLAGSAPLKATWRGTPVVYYVRVGRFIKVGYSANLAERMRAYPPDAELLAYEPGSRHLESKRIKEFTRYRQAAREWFAPGPLLLQHIKSLQVAAA